MTTYPSRAETSGRRSLWFGFLAGPVIWSLYFMVGYALVEFACRFGLLRFNLLGLSGVSAVIIGLTLISLAATLYGGYLAYRQWQEMRREGQDQMDRDRAERSGPFLAFVGLLLSGLFALLILLTGVPALVLSPC